MARLKRKLNNGGSAKSFHGGKNWFAIARLARQPHMNPYKRPIGDKSRQVEGIRAPRWRLAQSFATNSGRNAQSRMNALLRESGGRLFQEDAVSMARSRWYQAQNCLRAAIRSEVISSIKVLAPSEWRRKGGPAWVKELVDKIPGDFNPYTQLERMEGIKSQPITKVKRLAAILWPPSDPLKWSDEHDSSLSAIPAKERVRINMLWLIAANDEEWIEAYVNEQPWLAYAENSMTNDVTIFT